MARRRKKAEPTTEPQVRRKFPPPSMPPMATKCPYGTKQGLCACGAWHMGVV